MLEDIFPTYLSNVLNQKLPMEKVNEIRLRANKKIVVSVLGKLYYIDGEGLTSNEKTAITAPKILLDEIIRRASEYSLYAFSNQLKQGFLTIMGGIRIGICGDVVSENGHIKTIKNFSALNIRIPHEVKNCSLNALPFLVQNEFLNTLIISPPGAGKTTFIRDVLYQLSSRGYCYNVLLIDERFEISNCVNGEPQLDVGNFTDIISGATKLYGLENGVRSMRPDIVVTDELYSEKDIEAINIASNCGVKVICSTHCSNIESLKQKPFFASMFDNKVFKRIIVLSSRKGPGTLEGVYDENFRCLSY